MNCKNCIYYKPHSLYGFGYCEKKGSIVFGDESCKDVVPAVREDLIKAIEAYGWVYCSECRKALFSVEELDQHLSLGHTLFNEFMEDFVASEEAPGAD